MFLAPNFLGGGFPEFFEPIYKIDTGCDHVAKFRGDRPRELGDYALKKRKTSRAFHYRAMHFSAYARSWDRMSSVCPSVRLSVRLSVCDVGGL